MILRNLARVTAAALLTGTVVATVTSPAFAAPREGDISVAVEGLPLDSADPDRIANLKIVNKSGRTARNVMIAFDFRELDLSKVTEQLKGQGCEEEELQYVCVYGDIRRNQTVTDEPLPIYPKDGASGPAGTVKIMVSFDGTDTHPDDNEVEVPITITGPTSTPSPTPTGTPTATPTATPTGTATPTVTPTPGGGTGGGGGLPVTGPAVIGIGLAGIAAVVLGVFLYLGARRRRTSLVTPDDVA